MVGMIQFEAIKLYIQNSSNGTNVSGKEIFNEQMWVYFIKSKDGVNLANNANLFGNWGIKYLIRNFNIHFSAVHWYTLLLISNPNHALHLQILDDITAIVILPTTFNMNRRVYVINDMKFSLFRAAPKHFAFVNHQRVQEIGVYQQLVDLMTLFTRIHVNNDVYIVNLSQFV